MKKHYICRADMAAAVKHTGAARIGRDRPGPAINEEDVSTLLYIIERRVFLEPTICSLYQYKVCPGQRAWLQAARTRSAGSQ